MALVRRLLLLSVAVSLLAFSGCSDGEITILPPAPRDWSASDYTLSVTASATAVQAGDPVTFRASLTAPTGDDISDSVEFATEMTPSLGVLDDGAGQYRFTNADTYTYFASVDLLGATLVGAVSVVVSAGPAASVDLQLSVPVTEAGNPVGLTSKVYDLWGNRLEVSDGDVVYSVSPNASLTSDQVVATTAGSYTVTSTLADGTASDSEGLSVLPAEPASLAISLSSYDVEKGQGIVVDTQVLDNFGNDVDYPVELSTDPTTGTETWADFVRFHEEGVFTVLADITEYGLHAEDGPVLVDSTGPSIRITYPPRGAELESSAGEVVTVTGTVVDAISGVSSVSVNGATVALQAGGAFSHDLHAGFGLNTLEVVAVDGDSNSADLFSTYLWGDYTPQGQPHEDAVLARLNEGAIDAMETLLAGQISNGSIQSAISGQSLGNINGTPVVLSSVSIGNPVLDLDTFSGTPDGFLRVFAGFSPVSLAASVTRVSVPGFGFLNLYADATFSVSMSTFEAISDVELSVDSNNIIVADIISGSTLVNIDGTSINNDYFDTYVDWGCGSCNPDFSGWPWDWDLDLVDCACVAGEDAANAVLGLLSDVLSFLVNILFDLVDILIDLLEPLLEGVVAGLLESELAPIIEDALAGIEIVTDIDLMGVTISLDALPQEIDIDDYGMLIALESAVTAPLGPAAPNTLGALYDTESVWPTYSYTEDLHLSIGDGFLNQLLHSAWQGGVLNMTMDAAELGLDISQIDSILPLTQLELSMQPLLPPVVGPGPTGQMELSIGDLLINVTGDPGGVSGLMMQLAVTVIADAQFTVDSENDIIFDFTDPVLYMDFVHSDPWVVNGEVVENVMESVIDILIPNLIDTLGGLGGFQMPELGGFAINSSAFVREAPPAAYLTMSGDIVIQ
jgi:hypothetical protein